MEARVAVAHGHINAYNIADAMEADYDRYYRLLNCGFRLPASSGTDWWITDHNRVFVQVQGDFTYDTWIAGLRAGRTFVSNGPLREFRVNDKGPGASLETSGPLQISATVISRLPFERIQIVYNGEVVAERSSRNQREAKLEEEIVVARGGWIPAPLSSRGQTHAGRTGLAPNSPSYGAVPGTPQRQAESAPA